jgi:hypothetical protein
MTYLNKLGKLDFYYEFSGKQVQKLFVVKFSYGTFNGTNKFEFNEESKTFKEFSEMLTYMDELKKYCTQMGFTNGADKKARNKSGI